MTKISVDWICLLLTSRFIFFRRCRCQRCPGWRSWSR